MSVAAFRFLRIPTGSLAHYLASRTQFLVYSGDFVKHLALCLYTQIIEHGGGSDLSKVNVHISSTVKGVDMESSDLIALLTIFFRKFSDNFR